MQLTERVAESDSAAAGKAGERSRQPRSRLYRKFVLLFVALVGGALLTSGILELWFSYQESKRALAEIQQAKAIAAAARIEQFMEEITRQIGWTSRAQWSSSSIEQRRLEYLRLLSQSPAITELSHIDGNGREELRISRLAVDVIGSGTDFSSEPSFTEPEVGTPWFSPVYFRRESEPYLTVAIAGPGRNGGVTVADVNLKFMWDVISRVKVGEGGYAYAVDSRGWLIAHPDIGLVLRQSDVSRLPQVAAALNRPAAPIDALEVSGETLDGQPVLTAHAAVAPLGWTVFVDLPLSEALAPVYSSLVRTAALVLLGLGLSVLAGLLLARLVLGPITTLQLLAARIGEGDLGRRIQLRTGDELEDLAEQFNEMTARLQDAYATLEQKVELRTKELSEALEQQTATADVLKVISRSTFDLRVVLDTLVVSAVRLCDAYDAVILLNEDGWLLLGAHHGPIPIDFVKRRLARDWTAGRAVIDKTPVHIHDLLAEAEEFPEGYEMAVRLGHRTILSVPLLRENEAIGVITIRRTEVRPFTDRQIELLTTFADQAVIAIENVRLFEQVQARTRELQQALDYQTATGEVLSVMSRSPTDAGPVFNTIVKSASKLGHAVYSVVQTYDGDLLHVAATHNFSPEVLGPYLRMYPRRPDRHQMSGRAVLDGRAVHVPDILDDPEYPRELALAGKWRAMLSVPMLRDGTPVGVITVAKAEPGAFSRREIDLLNVFADQAVIAIENVRLFQEVQARTRELDQSVKELRALGEVSQAVNSTLDVETVLNTIVAKAVQLSRTDAGSIYVLNKAHTKFRLRATYGMDDATVAAIRDRSIRAGETAIGQATEQRQPVQIPDVQDAPSARVLDVVLQAGFRAVLIVPLVGPDRAIGVLVIRRKVPGAFPTATVDLLQTFAAQSVLAIQNARLFNEIEEKGRQLELASRHKSQFLANMSHELRTPLNAILGYSELILDDIYGAVPDKARTALERIQSNGKHLLGLINDVLDLAKIEAGRLTLSLADYSLDELVRGVVIALEPVASEKQLALKVDVPSELPIGHGDEQRIRQVLLNLVGNAIKFTDAGEVTIRAAAANGSFQVSVADTGPGISAADQARLFQEFQQADSSSTRKKGGSGLGLAISKRFIEMHDGRIWVESEPGCGATFSFILPITVEDQADEA